MATNVLRPEEWPEIVRAIQAEDPSAAPRLVERERRFDNFFSSYKYTPILRGGGTTIASTVDYVTVDRLGLKVWITVQVSATAVGPAFSDLSLSLPPDLPSPTFTAGLYLAGEMTVRIAATSTIRSGTAWINVDRVNGRLDNTATLLGSGFTIAIGDTVAMCIAYNTAYNPLV